MKFSKNIFLVILLTAALSACEGLVDGINEDPNDIVADEVSAELYLTGAQLANISAQAGHLNRITGMYTGQLIGFGSLYSNIYGFNLTTSEVANLWSHIYVGSVTNLRVLREQAADDDLLVGISKVTEAHAIGTAASLFGDIPYSEINDPEISDPQFDSQVSVFNAMIDLLDDGIADLQAADSRRLDEDIIFNGDANKWIEAANTLKARYHLQMREYGEALAAAQNGISSDEGTMQFIPRGSASTSEGDKNLFWQILAGPRTGDIGTGDSYLMQILNSDSTIYRGNAKTDETARFEYYTIDESGGVPNQGIVEQYEPQDLVSYAENQLILAEAAARETGFGTGLGHLNDFRAWLNTGEMVNENFQNEPYEYQPYDAADFAPGGMENQDNIDQNRALLREIIEERYVSGFGMFMPFNDDRRLRQNENDITVDFFLKDGPGPDVTTGEYPERLPYSDEELDANSNSPDEDPGLFSKTEVNQL